MELSKELLGLGRCLRRTHQPSHKAMHLHTSFDNPQSLKFNLKRISVRLHPINVCPNCLIEPRRRVHSFGQRRIPSWRRWELAPAACYMVAGEEPALIRSQHPCAQDALHELLLADGQAQLLLMPGLSDVSHLHSADSHRTTLANGPSSLKGSAKRCATAKSHGIRSR